MSTPKYSAEFKEQVVLEIVQKSGPVAGVAGSYGPVAQAVGGRVTGWRRGHPGLGADAVTAEERAGIGRPRAELREARMGNGFPEGSGGLLRPGVRVSAEHRRIHRGGGDRPVRSVRRWVEASGSGCCARRNRPESSTTRRGEDPTAIIVVGFLDESERAHGCRRIHAEPARSGVEASRSAWSAGSWRRRVPLPVGPPGTGRDGSCRRRIFRAGPTGCAETSPPPRPG